MAPVFAEFHFSETQIAETSNVEIPARRITNCKSIYETETSLRRILFFRVPKCAESPMILNTTNRF